MQKEVEQKIIALLELEGVEEEKRVDIINELGGFILQTVLVKVTETLSDEDVITFDKVLSQENVQEVELFLKEHVKNLDDIVKEASQEVIQAYKEA